MPRSRMLRHLELGRVPQLAVVTGVQVTIAVGVSQQTVLGLDVVVRTLRLAEDGQSGTELAGVANPAALVDELELLTAIREILQLAAGDHAA